MDANPCACESSRSQLSHAQGFISISLTVAPEYSIENVEILKFLKNSPEFTAFSCTKLKGQSDQSSNFRGVGVLPTVTNFFALEAQGLNFPTHKDSYQYLAPLRQIILLKICYFQNLFREPEELSKIQNQRHFFSTIRNILRH